MAAGDIIYATAILQAGTGTNSTPTGSTSPVTAVGAPTGLTFSAGPQGIVEYTASAVVVNAGGGDPKCGVMIRTGGTIGAGTIVYDPAVEPNPRWNQNIGSGAFGPTIGDTVLGLTPGTVYNATVVHWTTAGTVALNSQKLTLKIL